MKTKLTDWWNGIEQDVQAYDHGDYNEWRFGAMCEGHYETMVLEGRETGGHPFDMPEWLERQLHFENVVYTLSMRVRWFVGGLWCAWFGHPDRCVDIQEGSAESPWVAWSCSSCGNGGHGWW